LITDSNKEFSDNEEKRSETRREINLEGLKKGLSDEEKFAKKREKTNIESDEKSAAQQTEIAENLKNAKWDIAAQGVEALFTLNGFKFEKELNQLQVEKDARLANENLTQEERSAIEAEYTQRANEIKAKQAKSDKLNALFQVAINTAMGVTNALSKVVTAPLVPFIIAQGAIQAALIAAQPIPEYATGVVSTPERFIAGEKGRELMYKNNVAFMVNEPTLFDGKEFKGFGIKSNPETEKIISSGRRSEFVGKQMTDDRIVSKLDRLIKVSEKQKQPINNKGIETGYRFKNGKVNLINRYRYGN